MKNDIHTIVAGLGMLLLIASAVFAVIWMFGIDRAGVVAFASFAGGIVASVTALITYTIDHKRN